MHRTAVRAGLDVLRETTGVNYAGEQVVISGPVTAVESSNGGTYVQVNGDEHWYELPDVVATESIAEASWPVQ